VAARASGLTILPAMLRVSGTSNGRRGFDFVFQVVHSHEEHVSAEALRFAWETCSARDRWKMGLLPACLPTAIMKSMSQVDIVSRQGNLIHSVEEWVVEAKPAKADHWQEGRSAKELAKAWIKGSGPAALIAVLDLDPATAGMRIERAVAEAQTAFDSWPGGRRNHDLLITGRARGGETTIGLEAKADETYGQTLRAYKNAAQRLIDRGVRTNAQLRLAELTTALAGATPLEGLLYLRYQLFSGIAGTLTEAHRGGQAVFVVHEFVTEKTQPRLRAANEAALTAFTERLFGSHPPAGESSWLLGPFHVPADRWADVPLWIGKISTDVTKSQSW
jgi:hypothetical protein